MLILPMGSIIPLSMKAIMGMKTSPTFLSEAFDLGDNILKPPTVGYGI